jgi:hypothetical protein
MLSRGKKKKNITINYKNKGNISLKILTISGIIIHPKIILNNKKKNIYWRWKINKDT